MISPNQKSTDQTESLGGGATTLGGGTVINLGGGTPETGSDPFRLNLSLRIGLYGLVVVGTVPSQAPGRGGICFKRFYDIPLLLDCLAHVTSNKK